MRAIGYQKSLPISEINSLSDIDQPRPQAAGTDLLVEIRAVSVNPVDTKVRMRAEPEDGAYKVLGWDATGVVVGVGKDTSRFKVGDEVFYAGDVTRAGTNSEFHLIDERIVGHKPKSLSWAQAAALPLTAITAWEALFERLKVSDPTPTAANTLLIIGGAGGVGSIAIQLARKLTNLTVIATASRPETRQWATDLGAHYVIDHSNPLAGEIEALGITAPDFVFSTTNTGDHLSEIAKLIAPQGRFCLIDDPADLNIMPFKLKSISTHWEMMFTRSMFQTSDMDEQGKLLNQVSRLVDEGTLKTTLGEHFGTINAANLKKAHAHLETGKARGKVVLEGFGD
ncbi:zinc-binding alcohol dehydrogenase family protein [Roseibium algae]|uniref:Zinc-type alcohol dehydrogenase-like protein n=1 Tax=Roseibium algae TaxID=3123038 RepID=A0ABU8TP56_9HYPH